MLVVLVCGGVVLEDKLKGPPSPELRWTAGPMTFPEGLWGVWSMEPFFWEGGGPSPPQCDWSRGHQPLRTRVGKNGWTGIGRSHIGSLLTGTAFSQSYILAGRQTAFWGWWIMRMTGGWVA